MACGDSPGDIVESRNNDFFTESSHKDGKKGEHSKLNKDGWRAGEQRAGEWVQVCGMH